MGDWRGKTLAKVREIIHEADPEIVEEWKSVASAATGLPWWHVAAPLVITLVAVLSWSLRPHDRTVTGQAAVASVAGKIAV